MVTWVRRASDSQKAHAVQTPVEPRANECGELGRADGWLRLRATGPHARARRAPSSVRVGPARKGGMLVLGQTSAASAGDVVGAAGAVCQRFSGAGSRPRRMYALFRRCAW
jgi:hypothetical protein